MRDIHQKGFGLFEALVVVAMIAVISAVVFGAFLDVRKKASIEGQISVLVSTLERARSMTLSSENDYHYGVHLEQSSIILFRGDVYDFGTTTNLTEVVVSPMEISDISLNGGGVDVVFQRLTGATNNHGTVTISDLSDGSSAVITIYATGVVEKN